MYGLEPAFPSSGYTGLTMREHCASLILAALSGHTYVQLRGSDPKELALIAVERADALLEELGKEGDQA